jgi:hypothetical protein
MAMSSSSSEINALVMEKLPDMEGAQAAAKDKKKKKKSVKGVDIEDMFSFDAEKLEKVSKPVKKKKEEPSGEITLSQIQKMWKISAKMSGEQETTESPESGNPKEEEMMKTKRDLEQIEDDPSLLCFPSEEEIRPTMAKKIDTDEKKGPLLRFPSPSRSRQGSPKKRNESPEKPSAVTSMKASAAEFVPPSIAAAATVAGKEPSPSGLKASATEFVPPGVTSAAKAPSTMKADAAAFVPPGLEAKLCSKDVSEAITETRKTEEQPSSEACWPHALFTPPARVQAPSIEQLPTEIFQPKVPALTLNLGQVSTTAADTTSTADDTIDVADAKWSARLGRSNVESLLGRVKQCLMSKVNLGPAAPVADPVIGKVAEKVRHIEEKEADNNAEKEREAAIKAIQKKEQQDTATKEAQSTMDEALMDCFLQAVKTRIKDRDLPIMGTTLYGKHMRAARRIGTSCDVKDSSFVWLRPFLESLEDASLLKLKPEVKDPTVTWINRDHKLLKEWKPWAFKETVGSQKACGPTARR